MKLRILVAVLAALHCGSTASHALDAAIAEAYVGLSLTLPTPARVIVCHGFGCRLRTEVALGKGDHAKLAELLAAGRASPQAERRAVAVAAAWFDRRVGPAAGTTGRVARAGVATRQGAGQMDCIDTSRNVTSLLLVLEQLRLLRHHVVEGPAARGALIDLRWPHATAVMRESKSAQQWAVDIWTHKYGELPDVKPLDEWKSARE
ncbi:MAG: hypothetical protein QOI12_2406 [Alphaproteobacteria bacterium]|jgi:hypothetical protein|nr:hypothetical protein [Alphaproteobacteria bacterium]